MNTTSNSGVGAFRAGAALAGLALCALALAGCSNHGPVGLFAPELFGHHLDAPDLEYYDLAASNDFTTYSPTANGSCGGNCSAEPENSSDGFQLGVYIANGGGTGTYEPVSVTFTSSDPHVVWEWTGQGSAAFNGSWGTPPAGQGNYGTAVSPGGAGNEILPSDQSTVFLYQGYYNSSDQDLVDASQTYSACFYYTPNASYSTNNTQQITVPIQMYITDGLGNSYISIFDIYVTQDF